MDARDKPVHDERESVTFGPSSIGRALVSLVSGAALPGTSPCERTNMSIKGWMGARRPNHQGQGHVRAARANRRDRQTPSWARPLALVVTREVESDVMTLKAACASPSETLKGELSGGA